VDRMTVSIRTARASDAADIARLTVQLGYDVDEATVADRLERMLSHVDEPFLIAEVDGRAAGWLHAAKTEFVDTGPFVVIGGLVVDKDFRRLGIGRLLMERAEAWALERGCSLVCLWSSSGRTAAHRFYQDLGYSNVKTQYVFAKSLGADGEEKISRMVPRTDQ
jgi:GNAT superfamily N-acetyltransferase